MIKLVIAIIIFNATAYAPNSSYSESSKKIVQSRYINGDDTDAWGLPITEFTLACSLRYHGYIFVFLSDIPESRIRYCTDSVEYGLNDKRIDIAITDGSSDQRHDAALVFGRKKVLAKLISAYDFLNCRNLDIPSKKIDMHKAVIAQLYVDKESCL